MKSLIIYFSHKGENWMENGIENINKGNTEVFAEIIKEATNGDLFEVKEDKPYSNDYKKCCDEAKIEIDNNERPKVKELLSSIDEYDTIFIGGPVWWSHLPMPMFTVLEKLDFKNKTVKYFTTHEGSGIGNVNKDIDLLCKGALIKEPLAIRGCKVKENESLIKEWSLK